MADERYRYILGKRFERIPGPERQYREISTGRVVSRSYVYARSTRRKVSERDIQYRQQRRGETVHQKRIRWYANHVNHSVWNREQESGVLTPDDYISFDQAEDDVDFQVYEGLIHSRYEEDRDYGYAYFRELEEEYDSEEWGETP